MIGTGRCQKWSVRLAPLCGTSETWQPVRRGRTELKLCINSRPCHPEHAGRIVSELSEEAQRQAGAAVL
jgi:hypothetical protein